MLKITKIIAGSLVFTTSLLGYFHSKYWLIATMFIGLNILQFGITNFCPLEKILEKLGYKENN